MKTVQGLHHITAISGPAQENLDFYAGVLGMRLVKKSVNQDDPGTYHLFYADAEGRPGSDLTFFPWAQMAPVRKGVGLTTEVQLAVGEDSLGFWQERFQRYGYQFSPPELRFGEKTLVLKDPHGLELALVEAPGRTFAPWEKSGIPQDKQVRGLHGARMWQQSLERTGRFLQEVMGYERVGYEAGWTRYAVAGGGSGNVLDIKELPNAPRGQWGTGSVHHLAFRVDNTQHEMQVRERVSQAGMRPSQPIDRFWFKSVYFQEPGGVVFELATDGPGFAVDEDPAHLGEKLVLPPWLEVHRNQIEAVLPPLVSPQGD